MISDELPVAGFQTPVALWIAQSRSLAPFLGWLGLAIAIVAVAGVVLLMYRRNVLAGEATRDAQAGLMDNLRAMRDRGELNPDEYDAAKRAMVARLSGPGAPFVHKPAGTPGAKVAAPGFDLTGAPLPRPPDGPART